MLPWEQPLGGPELWNKVITEPTDPAGRDSHNLSQTHTHMLIEKNQTQVTQPIYCLSRKKTTTQNSENVEKRTPLNYTGSHKQNKVSLYLHQQG